jgi:exopolyphosphatase/guanosine-5'-triphosphate,3'-diphosphate pyrophosphatase
MDIGGGSLELALSAGGVVDRLLSFPLGTVRLTERFLGMTPRRGDVATLRREVRRELKAHWRVREWRGAQVIGSGGTFTNLAGMVLARQGLLTARTVHATRVERLDLEHLIDTLGAMSPGERLKVPGLNKERADIILAGLCVAAEVLGRVDTRALVVSRYGIREGIVLDAARVAPIAADPGEARERSIRELGERCRYDEPHARHVRDLSLQLFDALGERLGLHAADRQLLGDAALLHDIGYHISYDTHHKHSYHLILHADLLGISPADQVVLANVARYHRGALPRRAQRNYGSLDKDSRRRIKHLAALLRIADGLDRGHVGAVGQVKVRWSARSLRITPQPSAPGGAMRLELWGASRRQSLLERVAGTRVEFVDADGAVYGDADADDADTAVRAIRA